MARVAALGVDLVPVAAVLVAVALDVAQVAARVPALVYDQGHIDPATMTNDSLLDNDAFQ